MPPTLRPRKRKAVEQPDSEPKPEDPAPPRSRRRTTRAPHAVSNKPVATTKRPRRSRKGLQNMLEMPLDIVYEILAYLNPGDLVHLRKVNGVFHEFLSSPGAAPCWATARANWEANEGEIPDRPDDMDEIDFLDYLFGKYCQGCSKSMGSVSICWEIRRRYCAACRTNITAYWQPQIVYAGYIERFLPEDFRQRQDFYRRNTVHEIREILPIVCKDPLPAHKVIRGTLPYLEEDLEEFKRKMNELTHDELFDYLRLKRDGLERRRKIEIPILADWFSSQKRARAEVLRAKKGDRMESIVAKLEALGWGDEIKLMDATWLAKFTALPVVKQAKPMTDRVWNNALPGVVEFLHEAKAGRILEERRRVVTSRLQTFIKTIPKLQPYRPGVPSPIDIALGFPKAREIIEQPNGVEVNEDSFDVLRDLLPGFVAQWQQDVRKFFGDLVRSAVKLAVGGDPLSLAVGTYFMCECGQTMSSYVNASWHRCTKRNFDARDEVKDMYELWAASTLLAHTRFWQPRDFTLASRAQELVKLFALDPARTTAADMDESPLRLACSTCDQPSLFRKGEVCVFTWRYAMYKHESKDCQLYVVPVAQAAAVKELEGFARTRCEREWAEMLAGTRRRHHLSFDCAHCDIGLRALVTYHSLGGVTEHVKSKHDITNPTKGKDFWASQECNLDEQMHKSDFFVKLLPLTSRDSEYGVVHYERLRRDGRAILYDFDKECPADLSSFL